MSNRKLWNDLVSKLEISKSKFNQSFKCLNKTKTPKDKTQIKHLKILIAHHNKIANEIAQAYHLLSPDQEIQITNFFQTIKTRLSVLFTRLNKEFQIPNNLTDSIEAKFSESEEESSGTEDSDKDSDKDSDTEDLAPPLELSVLEGDSNSVNNSDKKIPNPDNSSDKKILKMTMTPAEFINTAAKLLPDFDGKFENLQRFLDALSLLDTIKESNESIAVTLIKTKLLGTARNLINSENSIESIKATLVAKVKGNTTQAVTAKLLNIRQNNKSPNDFAKDIEETTKLLQNAYISEGLTPELAETYSTQTAVKAVIKNANSDKIKIIMQAGQFSSVNQAATKFIESSSDVDASTHINYMQRNQLKG